MANNFNTFTGARGGNRQGFADNCYRMRWMEGTVKVTQGYDSGLDTAVFRLTLDGYFKEECLCCPYGEPCMSDCVSCFIPEVGGGWACVEDGRFCIEFEPEDTDIDCTSHVAKGGDLYRNCMCDPPQSEKFSIEIGWQQDTTPGTSLTNVDIQRMINSAINASSTGQGFGHMSPEDAATVERFRAQKKCHCEDTIFI
jgi:hypothetical protein